MELFTKKKVEIIVETPMISRLVAAARATSVPGYTVLSVIEGHGRNGLFNEDLLTRTGSGRLFMVVASPETAERFLSAAAAELAEHRAIFLVSDVQVLRDEHF